MISTPADFSLRISCRPFMASRYRTDLSSPEGPHERPQPPSPVAACGSAVPCRGEGIGGEVSGMARMSGGEAVVQALLAQGIETLFVLPGVQNDALFSALYDAAERLRVIVVRHEQAAGYMAYGYAAASGRAGAYCVVPGPGFLNTTAALATAYGASAPVLCLSGQIPSPYIGRGTGLLHEIPDQLGIMQRLTKWAARIEAPQDAARLVAEAFAQMATGRPRPVALEMPMDVMAADAWLEVDPVAP